MFRATIRMYVLGSMLRAKESMRTEYKEFCLKDNVRHLCGSDQIRSMIHDATFPKRFNDVVTYTAHKYLDVYLPKYASAFHNSNSGGNANALADTMTFLIGVDDDTEVTGIPFKGDFAQHEQAFQRHARSLLQTELRDECCLRVDVRVERCDVHEELLDDTTLDRQLKTQQRQQTHYRIVRRKYNKKRRQWNRAIMKYKGKLQTVFDDPTFQREFEAFLKERNLDSRFEKELAAPRYVVDLDKVKDYKRNEGTFVWWLIYFKDLKVTEWMKRKPKTPVFSKQSNAELCAVTQLTPLRQRWIRTNPTLNYFVMRVTIGRRARCARTISFIDPRRRHWRTVKRYLEDNEPHSTDIGL
jgi:hypothetical protein